MKNSILVYCILIFLLLSYSNFVLNFYGTDKNLNDKNSSLPTFIKTKELDFLKTQKLCNEKGDSKMIFDCRTDNKIVIYEKSNNNSPVNPTVFYKL